MTTAKTGTRKMADADIKSALAIYSQYHAVRLAGAVNERRLAMRRIYQLTRQAMTTFGRPEP